MIVLRFILVNSLLALAHAQTCNRTNCKTTAGSLKVHHASFERSADVKLVTLPVEHQFGITEGDRFERERICVDYCAKNLDKCKSLNLSPYTEGVTSQCYVYKNDVYEHWPEILHNTLRSSQTGWTSFYLKNSFCERSLCQNVGRCKPDFLKDTGYCECQGFSGRYCQHLDPMVEKTTGHWVFHDGTIKNIGPGTHHHGSIVNGKVLAVPDRKNLVIQCDGRGDKHQICFRAPEDGETCLTNLVRSTYCPDGMTFAFWFRVNRFSGSNGDVSHIMAGGVSSSTGISIFYGELHFGINFSFASHQYQCDLQGHTTHLHDSWNFIGMTYDNEANIFKCFFNDVVYKDMVENSVSYSAIYAYGFSGSNPFFVDDVIFIKKTSKSDMVKAIYQKTKK